MEVLVRCITRPVLKRMAHAICDADPSLENMKGRYKCAQKGCADHADYCAAFKQARAAASALARVRAKGEKKEEVVVGAVRAA